MKNAYLDYFRRRAIQEAQRIEFSTLAHFIEEVSDAGIQTVRVDLFEEAKPSELSFVYYITLTLFVTAQAGRNTTVYEYTEPLSTIANDGKRLTDISLMAPALSRVEEVQRLLSAANFALRHGRYVVPNQRFM